MSELEAISIDESKRFIALEVIIEKGRKTFIEVGEALAEIRDSKLYRIEHKTFEDYCVKKWGFTRMQASRLIAGAEVCNQLVTIGAQVFPQTESQARPLARLATPEKKAEAFAKAIQDSPTGTPTAKEVESAVRTIEGNFEPVPNFRRGAHKEAGKKKTEAKLQTIKSKGTLRAKIRLTVGGSIEVLEVGRVETRIGASCVIDMDVSSSREVKLALKGLFAARAASGIVKAAKEKEANP